MTRELDRRDFSANKVTPAKATELQSRAAEISTRLPGAHEVRIANFDATTGNPRVVTSLAAPPEADNYIQRALDHVRTISGVLGLAPTQPAEFVADPHIQRTSSNAVTVHLQQQYKGIPIFQATQAVHFAPDGTLQDTSGSSVTIAQEVPISPKLSVQEAVLRAAEYVAVPQPDEQGGTDQFGEPLNLTSVDLTGFVPRVIATFPNKPDSPTVLEAGPFGDAFKASLIWFALDNDLRLTWEVIVTMPSYEGQYRTIVDADSGEILYCHQLVQTVAAQGNVYRVDGASPRQMTNFPLALADYGLPIPGDLPPGFPDTWVAVDSTVGNSTNAHREVSGPPFQGTVQGGVLTFDPANAVGVDQNVLNTFYYCCYMHDYFYLLHFREADGNFQQDDFGRGGVGSDRVDARVFPESVVGTASMFTPVDGLGPVMRMGLVTSTNRHTALDSSVVFHEFMHGVTNRLVGGPGDDHALDAKQSGGMGEGWGDFNACTINNSTVVGAWVVNKAGGIRGFPYDSNFPDSFANLGTGRYTEVHNIGEIWCATLMEMTRNIGKALAVQLVVDALTLSPANPSFLDMRDAILRALDNMLAAGRLNANERTTAWRGIWRAFAKFGMGLCARSNGAQLTGIVADFNFPSWNEADLTVLAGGANAATTPIAYVTDFAGQGPTARLVYRANNGHVFELFYDPGTATWGSADLTVLAGGANAATTPIAYVTDFAGQGPTARLVYRGTDDHIHELFYEAAQATWGSADLTNQAGGMPATGTPVAYITNFTGQGPTARLVYRATNNHIFELFYDPGTAGWGSADLTALGGGMPASDTPIAYVTDFAGQGPTARLVYRATNGHVFELFYDPGTATWGSADLTALGGGTPAADPPIAYVTDFAGQGPTARLVYRGTDNHIHELFYEAAQATWGSADLTVLASSATAADPPIAYITDFAGQGPTARVIYRGTDNHIHELFYEAAQATWGSADLTVLACGANVVDPPIAYVTDFAGQGPTARLVYRGTDSHIHELYYFGP